MNDFGSIQFRFHSHLFVCLKCHQLLEQLEEEGIIERQFGTVPDTLGNQQFRSIIILHTSNQLSSYFTGITALLHL